jgi:hypothetical protein
MAGNITRFIMRMRLKAEGRRLKAEGKKQKAKSRRINCDYGKLI